MPAPSIGALPLLPSHLNLFGNRRYLNILYLDLSGTPHLQGYVVSNNRQRLSAAKKILPAAHLEISRGAPQEASDYCKKDGDFSEYGRLPMSK
ncbi:hypothetical protein CEXT_117961 [Caerostris extrusa]|uniref:CRESS-DNA virus Rep endonuclease domain-containing protein n=1 Tax=Caerostris extrusa TaxID=172846 RepID=A0AAV4XXM5_CAEEX|nr:hypothetical protein CEXT_117961 [Caerostris extrusa]